MPLEVTMILSSIEGAAITAVRIEGVAHEFSPIPGVVEDATDIRRRVLSAFEAAERTTDPVARSKLMTFVVVGGGPTGVEMAGAIRELALYTMRYDFRTIDPATAKIIIVEGQNRVLSAFHESLGRKAVNTVTKMGIELRLESHITDVQPDHVRAGGHDGVERRVRPAAARLLPHRGDQAAFFQRPVELHVSIVIDRHVGAHGRHHEAADVRPIAEHFDLAQRGLGYGADDRCADARPGAGGWRLYRALYAADRRGRRRADE